MLSRNAAIEFENSAEYIVQAGVGTAHFLRIIRGVVLKGASVSDFLFDGLILVLMSVILIFLAVMKFSRMRRIAG